MKKKLYPIQENCKIKIVVSILLALMSLQSIHGQTSGKNDYREIFGTKYAEAVNYLTDRPWIIDSLIANKIDPCFAKSIVFPELIRYSYLQDKIEIQGLLTLYVQYGEQYANFSIGRFQMKPGFAHKIEEDIRKNPQLRKDKKIIALDSANSPETRIARIKRLEDPEWQLQYLIWFIKINSTKYDAIKWKSKKEKLVFFASAYNCGYHNSYQYIQKTSTKSYYHTSLTNSQNRYNYSDICLFYWNSCNP